MKMYRQNVTFDPTRAPTAELNQEAGRELAMFEALINGFAKLGYLHPGANPELYGVEVMRNVAYQKSGMSAHKLDIYVPAGKEGPFPVVLYVHGGGFRLLSKDTHWMMAMAFARRGFLVANINYRLAPKHAFPAALEDASDAFRWVVRHAPGLGGDVSRMVFAGESAGANLVTSLALQTSYRRQEPWARAVFDTGVTPKAVIAACGIYEVGNAGRLIQGRRLPRVVRNWVQSMEDGYLGPLKGGDPVRTELADPVRILEKQQAPDRSLPPFFLPVGGNDPLVEDTHRLREALRSLGSDAHSRVYHGGGHAFHMFTMRPLAKRLWRDTFDFLDGRLRWRAGVLPGDDRLNRGSWLQNRIINAVAA
jgi:acetyl esterase